MESPAFFYTVFLSSLLVSITSYSIYVGFGPPSKSLRDPFEEHEDWSKVTCSTFSDNGFAEAVPRVIKPIILPLTSSNRDEPIFLQSKLKRSSSFPLRLRWNRRLSRLWHNLRQSPSAKAEGDCLWRKERGERVRQADLHSNGCLSPSVKKLATNFFPFRQRHHLWFHRRWCLWLSLLAKGRGNFLLDDARRLSKKDCKEDNTQRTDQ